MPITASTLRANIYRLLDQVLETQQPLEIDRKGRTLLIVPKDRTPRLERLPRRDDFIAGDPDDLVSLDWSSEWRP
jgi:Antitoxin Phd_YefM, type II toxin-antitoxin system